MAGFNFKFCNIEYFSVSSTLNFYFMANTATAAPITERLTCKEYADLRGITPDAVRNAIKKNHILPGVISKEKKGRDWFFEVDKKEAAK